LHCPVDDFRTVDEAIDWLQQKFKLADLARFIAKKIAEESENRGKLEEFNDDGGED
jgi:hypothetical protein